MEPLKKVSLRPWPAQKKEELSPEDLHIKFEQLTTERGHLRDITETALQEYVATGTDVPGATAETAESPKPAPKEAPSKQETREAVFNAQREMYGHLEWAKFAATNALDLLSLVLSSEPKGRNPASFSQTFREQGLNQGIPLGSFGIGREYHEFHARKPEELQAMEELTLRQEVVAKGSRMEALDCAADEILKAARMLEKEVRRETRYWQEIVSVSQKGWPIQRLRQNARHVPFGVRYGLPEAGDHFKARAFAPLQMDKDGSIILDPALTAKPKSLRVRVNVAGKVTGTSQSVVGTDAKSKSIEESIQLAQESLFEEELYHEMSLETRQLSAYGVDYRNAVIRVDASPLNSVQNQRQLLIDCVPWDEPASNEEDHSHDWLAQDIAKSLRLLLAHEHSMRLHRRSQLPPPITARSRDQQPPPLLRTLLTVLRHAEAVDSLSGYLDATVRSLTNAGLSVALEITRESSWATLTQTLSAPKAGFSAADQLLETFTKPLEGKTTMTLPTLTSAQSERLIILTRTTIGQPTFGTEHKLTLPSSLTSDLGLFRQQKFSTVDELKSYLDWILSLHIAHKLIRGSFLLQALSKSHEPRLKIAFKGGKNSASVSIYISVTCHEGVLKVAATSADSFQVEAGNVARTHVWAGTGEDLSLIGWIRSLAG